MKKIIFALKLFDMPLCGIMMGSVNKINSRKFGNILGKSMIVGAILLYIITSIKEMRKDYKISFTFILIIGIFFACIIINLIIKTIRKDIELWKKKIAITIYFGDIVYIIYSVIIENYKWFAWIVFITFILERFKNNSSNTDNSFK